MGLYVDRRNKWGYIHIPKTGGTSIINAISSLNGVECQSVSHQPVGKFEDVGGYNIFTVVRNPFTRFASSYYHYCRKHRSVEVETFIKSIYDFDYFYFPQSYFLLQGKTDEKMVSTICRYENYKKDVTEFLKSVNVNIDLQHLNRHPMYDIHPNLNQYKFYKTLYRNDWVIEWVVNKYKSDFKLFGYEMEI